MINLSKAPGEVVPCCLADEEFKIPVDRLFTHAHDDYSPTGIGMNYTNYWLGVGYWCRALREGDREAFEYLDPVPMSYSKYIRDLHPECPITANNIYTIAAIDALASEAVRLFASERKWDRQAVESLFSKAWFLITGQAPA